MEVEKTPQGWHWKITPEQIEKIKAHDRDTINQVYFDNYDTFKGMAKNYCRRVKRFNDWQDCVQQVYVDLPAYNYDCTAYFYLSLNGSFRYACGFPVHERFPIIVSLDTLLLCDEDGDGQTLYDRIASKIGIHYVEQESERREQERHALEIIAAQKSLTERDKDVLTAIAFNCWAYRGLFAYAYRKAHSA